MCAKTFWCVVLLFCSARSLSGQTQTVVDFEQFTGAPSVFSAIQPPVTVGIATFSGGQLLNAATFLPADRSVVYGTAATSSTLGTTCTGCLPTITIDFAQPVSNFSFLLLNGNIITVTYTVQDNLGGTQTITLVPNFQSGSGVVSLPDSGIRQVQITSNASEWDFFVDNITFVECAVNSVTVKTNENCDPNLNPNCSANIVVADGAETTKITTTVQPAQQVKVDLSTTFGTVQMVQTDSNGNAISDFTAGALAFGGTNTEIASISANACGQTFSDVGQVLNYNGFQFHLSNVTNAAFVDSSALDVAGIQAFFVARGSFLARFVLVGRIGGFLDTNNNGILDAGEPTYSAMGTPIPPGVQGMSAAAVFAMQAQVRGINPKVLIATAQKEQSLLSRTTLPSAVVLNFAMACGTPSNFVAQIQCAATTLANRFKDTSAFGRAISYPFFFHASDGLHHAVSAPCNVRPFPKGCEPVGFDVQTAATYAQYRYTPFIQSLPNGGAVFLFEVVWRSFGF